MIQKNLLSNFGQDLNAVVIGASGGIGQAFIKQLTHQPNIGSIHAFSRSEFEVESDKVTWGQIDVTSQESVEQAANSTKDGKPIDIIITATGFLHRGNISPEKSVRDIEFNNFEEVFAVNTFGPALIMKYFLPLLPRDRQSVVAFLSARVGSISDNQLGGWYAYRASKAALNMLIKNASIETARKFKQAAIIGLHPGTVETDLSEPFKSNIKEGHLFTPEYATECLLKVINDTTPEKTGALIDWDNKIIEY